MKDEEFEETRVDILNLLANRELGTYNENIVAHLNERISFFNKIIFEENDRYIENQNNDTDKDRYRNIEYYQTVEFALQYYQIRDLYFLNEP